MNKDTLFNEIDGERDFQFDEAVTAVFDDMLVRSIPCYRIIIDLYRRILGELLRAGDSVYDLGCSTGTTVLQLARLIDVRPLTWTGIDNSPHMIESASEKLRQSGVEPGSVSFACNDMTAVPLQNAGCVLLNYTLQFLRPIQRQPFLEKIHQALRSGGVLLLSEKTVLQDSRMNRLFINRYLNFKKENGYSDLEISRKREALENVLIPYTAEENLQMLRNAGFERVEPFFQWFNFSSFLAIKE